MKENKPEEMPFFEYQSYNKFLEGLKKWHRPKQLYGSLFYKGDLAMLIGPPGSGKSQYALMIGEELCKKYEGFGYKDFIVLYIDLEMSEYQQQMRLRGDNAENTHTFPKELVRLTIKEDDTRRFTVNNMLYLITKAISEKNIVAIIIDNLTCLCKGGSAAMFMQNLKIMRDYYKIEFLVVAHTKKSNSWKAITLSDLKGSSMITAIVDSIFALNMSRKGKDIRYVKQLKSRNSAIEYGEDNVMEYKIERAKDGVLYLKSQRTTTEEEQLDIDYEAKQELESKIRRLRTKGESIRKIADDLKVSPSKVWRCLH
ncbi:MAG: AAA family ATPase [Prevotella sp.]|nr:AAA family ATPase [Prevotella sp.]